MATTPKKKGRKIKANDPKVLSRLEQALKAGVTRKAAATYAGISEASFYSYLETAEADQENGKTDTPYLEFLEVVTRAEAEAEIHAVGTIRNAMATDWRAAAFFLERRKKDEWGRQDRFEMKHEGQIRTDVPVLPDADQRFSDVAEILKSAGVIPE